MNAMEIIQKGNFVEIKTFSWSAYYSFGYMFAFKINFTIKGSDRSLILCEHLLDFKKATKAEKIYYNKVEPKVYKRVPIAEMTKLKALFNKIIVPMNLEAGNTLIYELPAKQYEEFKTWHA